MSRQFIENEILSFSSTFFGPLLRNILVHAAFLVCKHYCSVKKVFLQIGFLLNMAIKVNLCPEDKHESIRVKLFFLLPVVTTGTYFTPTKSAECQACQMPLGPHPYFLSLMTSVHDF